MNLQSFLRRHIIILTAFSLITLLILCAIVIGLIIGHYSGVLDRIYDNQLSIEYSQGVILNHLNKQKQLLRVQETLMVNMGIALEGFHERLRDEMLYFIAEEEDK